MNVTTTRRFTVCFVLFSLFMSAQFLAIPASAGSMIRDSEIEAGLESLSMEMAQAAGFENGISIRVIIDPAYNAFVAGGKTVYINSGLLIKSRSAEEILGVIAHEIGHLASGHVPRRSESTQQVGIATALTALAAAAVAASGGSDLALGIVVGGIDRSQRNYQARSRNDESVADEWALRLLDKTGISSHGLADFMARSSGLRALPENRQSEYYNSHPGTDERLATFRDHLAKSNPGDKRISDQQLDDMSRLIIKLAAFVAPPQRTLSTPFQISWARSFSDKSIYKPASASLDYAQIIAQFRYGNTKAAKSGITMLIEQNPDDVWFHEFAGDIYLSSGQPEQAASFYRQALMLRPNSPQISLSLGRSLIAHQNTEALMEAIDVLETALAGEPKWGFVKHQLAIAYGRAGQLAHADVLLAEEALLQADRTRAIQLAKRALQQNNITPAIKVRAQDILFELNEPLSALE